MQLTAEPPEITKERLLRHRCCFFALVLMIAGVVMLANAQFTVTKVPLSMHSPGVAMELVQSNQDIYNIVGEPSDTSDAAKQNRETILLLQKLDRWFFIPAYFLFFQSVGIYMTVLLKKARWFGPVICLMVFIAAICDYFEDHWIVWSVQNLDSPNPIAISTFGYSKWGLLFVMLIGLAPLLWRYWPESAALRLLGAILGVYVVFSGAAGLIACALHHGGRVESASNALAAPVVFFMPFVAAFYHGTLQGLNRIANRLTTVKIFGFRPLSWIIEWPEYGAQPAAAKDKSVRT
jgi:hypothetical protein